MNPNRSLIDLSDIVLDQGSRSISLNLSINRGEHFAITGNNGSGKTTLAKIMSGESPSKSGRINYHFKDPYTRVRRVSFIDTGPQFGGANAMHYYQQRYNSWDMDGSLTVKEYLDSSGCNWRSASNRQIIQAFGIGHLLGKERIKLSSGETRKLLLTKAILHHPKVLLIDNLYVGLDEPSRRHINQLLDKLAAEMDMTLVLFGHFRELPNCISHYLNLSSPSIKLTGANKFWQLPLNTNVDTTLLDDIYDIYQENKAHVDSEEIIRMNDVNVQYGQSKIIGHLDWVVRRGEKWWIKGDNGSGKSTLVSLIYADNPRAYGESIYLLGRHRREAGSIWDVKRKFGFTSPELHAYLDNNLSAEQFVYTGLTDSFRVADTVPARTAKWVEKLLTYFKLIEKRNIPFNHFSTGEQRILLFIRAMAKCTSIWLLDEPFQGMDRQNLSRCRILLEKLAGPETTLIFISHFADEVPDFDCQLLQMPVK